MILNRRGYLTLAVSYKANLTTGFNGGELSPALAGRVDIDDYKFGARLIENFIPETQGGLKKFYGTDFVSKVTIPNDYCIVPFHGGDTTLFLYLHDGVVDVVAGGVLYNTDITIQCSGLDKLRWCQLNDEIYFVHPDTKPFIINYLGYNSDTEKFEFVGGELEFKDVPYFPLGWKGNYRGTITTTPYNAASTAASGTIRVSSTAGSETRLQMPDIVRGVSGSVNLFGTHKGSSDNSGFGTTTVQLVRIRNNVESVVFSNTTGTTKTIAY